MASSKSTHCPHPNGTEATCTTKERFNYSNNRCTTFLHFIKLSCCNIHNGLSIHAANPPTGSTSVNAKQPSEKELPIKTPHSEQQTKANGKNNRNACSGMHIKIVLLRILRIVKMQYWCLQVLNRWTSIPINGLLISQLLTERF